MAVRDQRSEVSLRPGKAYGPEGGQRSAGVCDALLFFLAVAVAVAVGFFLGRDYERINALAAEPTAPVVRITRAGAAARIEPRCPGNKRSASGPGGPTPWREIRGQPPAPRAYGPAGRSAGARGSRG